MSAIAQGNAVQRDVAVTSTPWQQRYARGLVMSDAVAVTWAVVGAQLVWFDSKTADASVKELGSVPYWLVSTVLIIGWLVCLHVAGSRDYRVLGTGAAEYQRILQATVAWFGIIAIVTLAFKIDLARGYLLLALPAGSLVLLLSRKLWRGWLVTKRSETDALSNNVVVVGVGARASTIIRELQGAPAAGYRVVGACLPDGDALDEDLVDGVPAGRLDDAVAFMRSVGGDTIAVSGTDYLPAAEIRKISWQLESGREHLVVSPSLIDIAGPRMSMRPVAGLSLIHVETPRFTGWRLFLKTTMDLVGAGVLAVLLSPVLLVIALLVKATSPGPVLFRQERVGLNGGTFRMLKFRSMVVDAEKRLEALEAERRDAGNAVMFKMANDPRITRTGAILRRFSLDELPQIFNVLTGDMSLVGPRPPLLSEVELYADEVYRRFLVKPGITGLWQVSGRSDLDWEQTVRLDLYYVENWSLASDLQILTRTVRAVLGRDGAY